MDITKLLSAFSNSDSVSALSQSSGAKPGQVSDLLAKAIPILMKGMEQNASTETGANSLAKALDDHAGGDISDTGAFLKNVDLSEGSKILGHILGGKQNDVQTGLAQKTGLSLSQVGTILSSAAPMLLSVLGGHKQNANVGNSGIGGMLSSLIGGSGGGLDNMISSALADEDGDGKPDILGKVGGIFGF